MAYMVIQNKKPIHIGRQDMVPKARLVEKRIERFVKIFQLFFQGDRIYSAALSQKLGVEIRTIQRDLEAMRKAGFPVNEIKKGCYSLDKNLFKHYEHFDDSELALVLAMKNAAIQLGPLFQDAADSVFNKLFRELAEEPLSPVCLQIEKPVLLDNRLFIKAVKAIQARKRITFTYEIYAPYTATVEPYKIIYFDGLWYLIGRDVERSANRTYALDRIKDFMVLKETFRRIPDDLDGNIWFSGERTTEVQILVDSDSAHHFKRRRIFPTQQIREEKKDGSLVVSFMVGNFEEIRNILKRWLPWIKILAPVELKDQFVDDMKAWLKWQKS
ncbi:MAG: WYL domain-containing transcriptional regulator [Deltaproteobacteria bacterium]|nr:WYL domain-containing transcriptional regulator [Deltaproteobacteria bacterium]